MKNVPRKLALPSVNWLHLSLKVFFSGRFDRSTFLSKNSKSYIFWSQPQRFHRFFFFFVFLFFLVAKKPLSQRHRQQKKQGKTLYFASFLLFVACAYVLMLVKNKGFLMAIYLPFFDSEETELCFRALFRRTWSKTKTN